MPITVGGYPKRVFFVNLPPNFTCGICQKISRDAVECSRGVHFFCESCVADVEYVQCSCCIDNVRKNPLKPNKAARNIVSEAFISCPEDRCTWSGKVHDYKQHELFDCSCSIVHCPYTGCRATVTKSTMQYHTTVCTFRNIACQHCNTKVANGRMIDHLQVCKNVCIPCPDCSIELVTRGNLSYHRENQCVKRLIDCPFNHVCKRRWTVEALKAHVEDTEREKQRREDKLAKKREKERKDREAEEERFLVERETAEALRREEAWREQREQELQAREWEASKRREAREAREERESIDARRAHLDKEKREKAETLKAVGDRQRQIKTLLDGHKRTENNNSHQRDTYRSDKHSRSYSQSRDGVDRGRGRSRSRGRDYESPVRNNYSRETSPVMIKKERPCYRDNRPAATIDPPHSRPVATVVKENHLCNEGKRCLCSFDEFNHICNSGNCKCIKEVAQHICNASVCSCRYTDVRLGSWCHCTYAINKHVCNGKGCTCSVVYMEHICNACPDCNCCMDKNLHLCSRAKK